jgi:hypothetical protein
MSLKTETYSYNEDDFIEKAGEMHEITVTITLCEYRNLIEERVYNDKAIEKLQEENERLRKQNDILLRLYAESNPELKQHICEACGLALEDIKAIL